MKDKFSYGPNGEEIGMEEIRLYNIENKACVVHVPQEGKVGGIIRCKTPLEEILKEAEAAGYTAIGYVDTYRYEFDRSADFEEWSNCSHE